MNGKERLLLIDTCGETAGVALSIGQEILASEDLVRGSASAEIVSAVKRLLEQASWRLVELNAVGVVSGPGSFTGTRAGLAAAKGLCEAVAIPLVAVSRLEVLADAASLRDGFVALDAGRDELYVREERIGREWLCSWDSLTALAKEDQDSGGKAKRIVIAEERFAERFAGCEVVLRPLHVGDALGTVLKRLRDRESDGLLDVALIDANYVREESDIYRKPTETAKPARAGGMMHDLWDVRRALPADIEAILAIEQACVEAPHWSEAVWREVIAKDEGSDPVRGSFAVEDNGRIVGFIVVSCADRVAEVESVAVSAEARRRGAGRALCLAAIAWSRARAAQVIELEVRASSVGALALYGSLGFTERGRRRGYYRDPTEDAMLMSAVL